MITLVEALNYRCLKRIHQPLGEFHVLVGPNGSGKSTFFDVVKFLGELASDPDGLESVIEKRTSNFYDLFWKGEGDRFELAIEVKIPEDLFKKAKNAILKTNNFIRYEVAIGVDKITEELNILDECLLTYDKEKKRISSQRKSICLGDREPLENFFFRRVGLKNHALVGYRTETGLGKKNNALMFRLDSRNSSLRNLPEDESKFPVATWLKKFLRKSVQVIVLDCQRMRESRPPAKFTQYLNPDGSNLPWLLKDFKGESYKRWIAHLQTAVPDLKHIRTVLRPEDRHRYLKILYKNGTEIPSWLVSDGTLRLLALTLPAYLKSQPGILLVEEIENGIHPRAIEVIVQSLSSVYDSQVLATTHSPAVVGCVEPEQVLCFSKTEEGATQIVSGDKHPKLKYWKGDPNLSVYFASGVLD